MFYIKQLKVAMAIFVLLFLICMQTSGRILQIAQIEGVEVQSLQISDDFENKKQISKQQNNNTNQLSLSSVLPNQQLKSVIHNIAQTAANLIDKKDQSKIDNKFDDFPESQTLAVKKQQEMPQSARSPNKQAPIENIQKQNPNINIINRIQQIQNFSQLGKSQQDNNKKDQQVRQADTELTRKETSNKTAQSGSALQGLIQQKSVNIPDISLNIIENEKKQKQIKNNINSQNGSLVANLAVQTGSDGLSVSNQSKIITPVAEIISSSNFINSSNPNELKAKIDIQATHKAAQQTQIHNTPNPSNSLTIASTALQQPSNKQTILQINNIDRLAKTQQDLQRVNINKTPQKQLTHKLNQVLNNQNKMIQETKLASLNNDNINQNLQKQNITSNSQQNLTKSNEKQIILQNVEQKQNPAVQVKPTPVVPAVQVKPTPVVPAVQVKPTPVVPAVQVKPTPVVPAVQVKPTPVVPAVQVKPTPVVPAVQVKPTPVVPAVQVKPTPVVPAVQVKPTPVVPAVQVKPTPVVPAVQVKPTPVVPAVQVKPTPVVPAVQVKPTPVVPAVQVKPTPVVPAVQVKPPQVDPFTNNVIQNKSKPSSIFSNINTTVVLPLTNLNIIQQNKPQNTKPIESFKANTTAPATFNNLLNQPPINNQIFGNFNFQIKIIGENNRTFIKAQPKEPKVVQLNRGLINRFGDRGLFLDKKNQFLKSDPRFSIISDVEMPTRTKLSLLELKKIQRDFNGKNNNQFRRQMGMTNTGMKRKCKNNFIDGRNIAVTDLPSPRQISNIVGSVRKQHQLNKQNVTLAFTLWGQFIDHDIEHSPSSQNQFLHIPIPRCDKSLDIDCNGSRVIPFSRSIFTTNGSSARVPINSVSTWIDGSMIYGSSQEQAKKLRKFERGYLKTSKVQSNLLPQGKKVQPSNNSLLKDAMDKNISNQTMQAGDSRSNQNLILLSFHTIFLREHNRLCDLILRNNFLLSDQQVYTIARNYVIALIQKITYDDFLPIVLGPTGYSKFIGKYPGYDSTIDATIQVQFSTVGFRYGHSLVVPQFPLVNLYGDKIQFIKIDGALFRPDLMSSVSLQRILRGASRTITKLKDGQFVDQIRNFLIIAPEIRKIRMDLLAINVQRGRDHGIPDYNSLRECYGLRRLSSFNQISAQFSKNEQIRTAYNSNINKIDSYIGIQAQKTVDGSVLGDAGVEIVGTTFRNLRNGDRFWYEKILPSDIISQIKQTKLSEIIIRNTAILQLQQDVFHYHFGIND